MNDALGTNAPSLYKKSVIQAYIYAGVTCGLTLVTLLMAFFWNRKMNFAEQKKSQNGESTMS